MSKKITLKSGNTLELQMASFSQGWKLSRVIANELKSVGIDIESQDFSKLSQLDVIKMLKGSILQLVGSVAFEEAFFDCASRCLYNEERVTRNTFESETARVDFIPCMVEVTKFNVSPFIEGLDLSLITSLIPAAQSPV